LLDERLLFALFGFLCHDHHRERIDLLQATDAVRKNADMLEGIGADDLWPLPTYQEMLLII